jgi:hypothetical protein
MGSIFSAALERTAERVGSLVGLGPPAAADCDPHARRPLSRLRQEGLYDTGKGRSAERRGLSAGSSRGSPRSRGPCRR